jgi:hypothetical protein
LHAETEAASDPETPLSTPGLAAPDSDISGLAPAGTVFEPVDGLDLSEATPPENALDAKMDSTSEAEPPAASGIELSANSVPDILSATETEPVTADALPSSQEAIEPAPEFIEQVSWTLPLESVAGSPDPRPGISLEELELPPNAPAADPEEISSTTLVEADTDTSHLEEWASGNADTPSPTLLLPHDEVEAELVEETPPPEATTPPPAEAETVVSTHTSLRQQARLQHRQRVITTKVQLLADQLMTLKDGPLSQMQQSMKLLAHRFAPTAWNDCQDTLEKARYRYQEATQLVRLANQLNRESEWPQQRIEMNLERAQAKIQSIEALAVQLDQRHQSLIQHYREAKQTWNEQAQRYKTLRQQFGDNSPHEKHLQRINYELQRLKQYFDPDHLFTPQAFEDKQRTITHLLALLTSESVDTTQEESMVGTP